MAPARTKHRLVSPRKLRRLRGFVFALFSQNRSKIARTTTRQIFLSRRLVLYGKSEKKDFFFFSPAQAQKRTDGNRKSRAMFFYAECITDSRRWVWFFLYHHTPNKKTPRLLASANDLLRKFSNASLHFYPSYDHFYYGTKLFAGIEIRLRRQLAAAASYAAHHAAATPRPTSAAPQIVLPYRKV